MKYKLSILIPTIPARIKTFANLIEKLSRQISACNAINDVELCSIMDSKGITIGKKRNKLLDLSQGEYVVFIDDDDTVSDDYVVKILNAIKSKPDCAGIIAKIDMRGHIIMSYHSIDFKEIKRFKNSAGVDTITNPPNHLDVIKRDIAISEKFEDSQYGEDNKWAQKILPQLKTEVKIDGIIYFYNADPHNSHTNGIGNKKNAYVS